MADRPILFNDAMVRAILDGRKTQTRRPIKPAWSQCLDLDEDADDREKARAQCPFGAPGDRLWVRECWGLVSYMDESDWHRHSVRGADDRILGHWRLRYRSDYGPNQEMCHWRPSILMPYWASRLTLRVTDVRVERVQDISEEDAQAEGLVRHAMGWTDGVNGYDTMTARDAFGELWSDTYGTESWAENPWCWCVSFERVEVGHE